MKTIERIIKYILKNGSVSVEMLSKDLRVSRQYIHRMLNELIEAGRLLKMGKAPHVYYNVSTPNLNEDSELIAYLDEQFLHNIF